MPIAKSLAKVQKTKADNKLHPRGRKLKQLTRAELRQHKLDEHKSKRNDAQQHRLERFRFLQELCRRTQKPTYSIEDIRTMCQAFIDRTVPELEELAKQRRPGRPPTNRQNQLQLQYDSELQEFKDGFNIADLQDEATVKNLLNWNGSWGGLNMLKMTRISQSSS